MNTRQTITLALVGILSLITLYGNGDIQTFWQSLATPGQGTNFVTAIRPFGRDAAGVVVLTFLAGAGDVEGNIAIAVCAALWLAFLMNQHKKPLLVERPIR